MAESKSSNSSPKQTCIDCHFLVFKMENFITGPKYCEKPVDLDYRNWVKEKGYNRQISYSLVKEKRKLQVNLPP